MNVRVEIQFESPTEEDVASMRSLARGLTNDQKSVRVVPDDRDARRLVAEFTMPTEPQMSAVDRIDRALRFRVENRVDSSISFPKTAAERLRAKRKAERRTAARRAAREQ